MGFINRKRKQNIKSPKRHINSTHLNWMGGPSFELTPVLRLKVMAASCFFGEPQYYQVDEGDDRDRRRGDRHHEGSRLSDAEREHLREQLDAIDRDEWRGLRCGRR